MAKHGLHDLHQRPTGLSSQTTDKPQFDLAQMNRSLLPPDSVHFKDKKI